MQPEVVAAATQYDYLMIRFRRGRHSRFSLKTENLTALGSGFRTISYNRQEGLEYLGVTVG